MERSTRSVRLKSTDGWDHFINLVDLVNPDMKLPPPKSGPAISKDWKFTEVAMFDLNKA